MPKTCKLEDSMFPVLVLVTAFVTSPATFVLHLSNQGSRPWKVELGCGLRLPIEFSTAIGPLRASPGEAPGRYATSKDSDLRCEHVIQWGWPTVFSDCAGNLRHVIQPGESIDLPWDRQVYSAVRTESEQWCYAAFPLASQTQQHGTLTLCKPSQSWDCDGARAVEFVIDTTQDAATIAF